MTNNSNSISVVSTTEILSPQDGPIKRNRDNVDPHSNKKPPFYLRVFLILCIFSLICLVLLFVYRQNSHFAEFFTRYVGGSVRIILSAVTSVFPFSLAESIFMLMIPAVILILIFSRPSGKSIVTLLCFSLVLFDIYAITVAPSYYRLPLHENLKIENRPVTSERLENTCRVLIDMLNETASEIYYGADGRSYTKNNFSELCDEILKCFDLLCEKYDFICPVGFRAKPVALSVPMTYLHVSGVYTYFTGEANINTNYPDYILPHTVAHEMSHARGIFNEGDANFVAFLVCLESDNPYVRYSGLMNIFPYVSNALYAENSQVYYDVMSGLTYSIYEEFDSFSEFFEKYSSSKAAEISVTLNDAFLKANGQSEGINSYGLVVDLTINYLEAHYDTFGTEN